MVYESRRIYTGGSRPLVSTSYSYSPCEDFPSAALRRPDLFVSYAPISRKGRKQHRVIVPVARMVHQRLSQVSPPPHRNHLNNVYDALDFARTGNQFVLVKYRPTPPPMSVPRSRVTYIEDLTNRSGLDEIDRETRSVQREMDNMLYRVAAGVPFSPSNLYHINHIPMRSASEVKDVADMRRMYVRDRNPDATWEPLGKTSLYRLPLIHYPSPAALGDQKYYYIGRQNLACLSFAGGRPIPKRRRFYPGYEDDRSSSVRDDITYRSFYSKQRNAANYAPNAAKGYVRSTQYQPIHYSRKTLLGDNGYKKELNMQESKWVKRAMANEKPPPPRKTEPAILPPVKEMRRESLTKEPKMEPPPPSRPINVTLPGPRKSITEIMKDDIPKVENLPEETIIVRRPSKLESVPGTPPVDVKAEETFKISSKKSKKPAPPPKEPTPPPPKEPTPPPKEPTPPPKEPTPPPKEATPPPPPPKEATPPPPPPKEPTPPPKEPTPPPREPTPPPPKEPTPPPKEPTPPPKEPTPPPPEPEPVAVEEIAAPVDAAAAAETEDKSDVSGVPEGSEVESNKGEDVADIPLDEELPQDEVCEAQNKVEGDPPADNGPTTEEAAETETSLVPEPESTPDAEVEVIPALDDVQPEPQPEAEAEAQVVGEEDNPVVEEESTPAVVSILVADIDGPMQVEGDERNGRTKQEPMTVEQIQADAERRRAEFARLLEEHHDIVEKVELLEHPVGKLESVIEKNVEIEKFSNSIEKEE